MTKLGSLLVALLSIGALLTACSSTHPSQTSYGSGGSSTSAPAPASTPVAGPAITISGMAFGAPITVSPGATITVVNDDTVEHSVTSNPKGAFDTHVDGGASKTFTAPTEPGTYPFTCVYHPSMTGTLVVS